MPTSIKFSIFISFLCLSILMACNPSSSNEHSSAEAFNRQKCDFAEGYMWSELRQSCIVPEDKGISLFTPLDSIGNHYQSVALFAKDEKKVEIFIVNELKTSILQVEEGNRNIWKNNEFILRLVNEKYVLTDLRLNVIYQGSK